MKKLIVLLSILLLCLMPLTASAERQIFRKPTFNFMLLNNIFVSDVERIPNPAFEEDNFASEKVNGYIGQFLLEKKIPYVANKDNYFLYPSKFSSEIKYVLDVNINTYGYGHITKPGYWEEYTTYRERKYRDRRGFWHTEQIPEYHSRFVPPRTVRVCYIDVVFDLKNLATGATIFNVRDTRERETDSPDDMAKRVVKDFLSNLKKLHDKNE